MFLKILHETTLCYLVHWVAIRFYKKHRYAFLLRLRQREILEEDQNYY